MPEEEIEPDVPKIGFAVGIGDDHRGELVDPVMAVTGEDLDVASFDDDLAAPTVIPLRRLVYESGQHGLYEGDPKRVTATDERELWMRPNPRGSNRFRNKWSFPVVLWREEPMVDIVAPAHTVATRWRDPAGRVHAVDGAEVIGRKMQRWTRCGMYDVDANEGWHGDEAPTCRACRVWVEMDL